jgi:anti-sigma B factor antagonist
MSLVGSGFAVAERREGPDRLIVRVNGEMDGANSADLALALNRAAKERIREVIVDLMGCAFIDSMGLVTILRGSKKVAARGGTLSVACSHPEIRRLFKITAIDQTVTIIDSLPSAY